MIRRSSYDWTGKRVRQRRIIWSVVLLLLSAGIVAGAVFFWRAIDNHPSLGSIHGRDAVA